jgi:hypothetical protein
MLAEKGLDPDAKRMPGSGAFAGFKTDIFTTLPYSFEMKNQEKVQLWEFWKQAKAQETPTRPAVLVIARNNTPPICVVDASTFLGLLVQIKKLQTI